MVRDVVYFGRNRPEGGTVGDDEWNRFLEQVVTPRFPDGYTVTLGRSVPPGHLVSIAFSAG